MTKKYTADDIQVLEGLEAVRQSPSIYLGSKNKQVLHMLKEVYENCVDLFLKDMNNYVAVLMDSNKEQQNFVVLDNGPGIPVSVHKQTGESTLTTVMARLSAGSNFKRDGKKKEVSRGNHGVGVSCVNAVSKKLQVWTCRHDQWYTQIFEKGKAKTDVKKCKFPSQFKNIGAKRNCGTIVQYTPDYTIVPKIILKEKEVYEFIKRNAELNTGLKVRFVGPKKDETFYNKKGIITILNDYIQEISANTLGKPFILETNQVDVAFQWSDKVGSDNFLSFVNGSLTSEGGTHLSGLYEIIGRSFKKFAKKKDFSSADLRNGLVVVIHYKTTNQVEYTSQDKSKLDSTEATSIVKQALEAPLTKWIEKNKNTVKKIIKRAIEIRKVEIESKKMLKAASSLKNKNKGGLDAKKLIQCSKKCPNNEIELFLTEGNSASGSASKARNPYNQEILKCRGKGLNVFRCTLAKALQNDEIKSFLTAIGASDKDIKQNQQVSNVRVGKILLFSDPDIDADQIDVLWLTWIYKFAPSMLEQGRVYKVNVPLYQASWHDKKGDHRVFGNTLKEIYKTAPKSAIINRFKGLGELLADQLEPFMNPETRHITKITLPQAKEKIKDFLKILGDDVSTRKKLLGIKERGKS